MTSEKGGTLCEHHHCLQSDKPTIQSLEGVVLCHKNGTAFRNTMKNNAENPDQYVCHTRLYLTTPESHQADRKCMFRLNVTCQESTRRLQQQGKPLPLLFIPRDPENLGHIQQEEQVDNSAVRAANDHVLLLIQLYDQKN